MHSNARMGAVAVAVAAIIIGLVMNRVRHSGESPADAPTPHKPIAPARVPAPSTYASATDPTRPDLTIAGALPSARAGSPQAMRDLAKALQLCSLLQASDEAAIVRKQAELAEGYERFARDTGRPIDQAAFQAEIDQKTEAQIQIKKACANVSAADAGSWLNWLERAAAAGDMDAKRDYASAVLHETSDASWMLENADEFARQKRLAFRFLHDVLAATGDCAVSNQMELLAPSPADAYTYALVGFEWGKAMQTQLGASPALAAENIAFMQRQLDLRAAKVPRAQQVSARATAQRVYPRCR